MFPVSWVSLSAVLATVLPGCILVLCLDVSDRIFTALTWFLTSIAWVGFVLGLDRQWTMFQPVACLISITTTSSLAVLTSRLPLFPLAAGAVFLAGIFWRAFIVYF